MDRALADREADVVHRYEAAELFPQVLELEHRWDAVLRGRSSCDCRLGRFEVREVDGLLDDDRRRGLERLAPELPPEPDEIREHGVHDADDPTRRDKCDEDDDGAEDGVPEQPELAAELDDLVAEVDPEDGADERAEEVAGA